VVFYGTLVRKEEDLPREHFAEESAKEKKFFPVCGSCNHVLSWFRRGTDGE
jgi:hypothetical protein